MHEDDVRLIRLLAIRRARANWQAGGESNIYEAKAWIGVAVLAGVDKDDLAEALSIVPEAVAEGVEIVRGVA